MKKKIMLCSSFFLYIYICKYLVGKADSLRSASNGKLQTHSLLQKADLAVADLTITYEREEGVDFTMPFMNLGEINLLQLMKELYQGF